MVRTKRKVEEGDYILITNNLVNAKQPVSLIELAIESLKEAYFRSRNN